jgi:hypothetical protein
MTAFASFAVSLAGFLAIYAVLHWRTNRGGRVQLVQWGWLALIIALATAVFVYGQVA